MELRLSHALSSRMLQKPTAMIEESLQDVDALRERLVQIAGHRMSGWERDFARLGEKLHLLSPLGTLARGYAIAWKLPDHVLLKKHLLCSLETRLKYNCPKVKSMPKSKEPKFEENLKRLETIVDQLENKEAPLDQSLALFEEGVKLARACQQTLEQAKKKVDVLIKETGELKPFEGEKES